MGEAVPPLCSAEGIGALESPRAPLHGGWRGSDGYRIHVVEICGPKQKQKQNKSNVGLNVRPTTPRNKYSGVCGENYKRKWIEIR